MPVEMDVWFDEDDGEHSESLLVEDLGERRYRLHEFPVFTESDVDRAVSVAREALRGLRRRLDDGDLAAAVAAGTPTTGIRSF